MTGPNFSEYEQRYRRMLEIQARQAAMQMAAEQEAMKLHYGYSAPLTDRYGRLNYVRNQFPEYLQNYLQGVGMAGGDTFRDLISRRLAERQAMMAPIPRQLT